MIFNWIFIILGDEELCVSIVENSPNVREVLEYRRGALQRRPPLGRSPARRFLRGEGLGSLAAWWREGCTAVEIDFESVIDELYAALQIFRRLVLGWIDSYDSNQILIVSGFSRSTKLSAWIFKSFAKFCKKSAICAKISVFFLQKSGNFTKVLQNSAIFF